MTEEAELGAADLGLRGSERLRRFEDEHAAVRHVATLVAKQAPAAVLFGSVVQEVVKLLGVAGGWLFRYEPDRSVSVLASSNIPGYVVGNRYPIDGPSVSAIVLDTGRPARIDDYAVVGGTIATRARDSGFGSGLGVPVAVDGRLWGVLCVGATSGERLPGDAEERLRHFTELVEAAISNADARDRLARLANQQSALRRLATIVAEGAPADELFNAVGYGVTAVLGAHAVALWRYGPNRSITVLAVVGGAPFPVGSHWPLDGRSVAASVFDTGRPARIDDYSRASGAIAESTRDSGFRSAVGAPIIVEGRVWGMITVASKEFEPLPSDTADRLGDFTELAATAIANAQAHDDLQALADEQAALRRVATLVAQGTSSEIVFATVCEEAGQLLEVPAVAVERYDADAHTTVLASWGEIDLWAGAGFRVGSRWPLDGPSVARTVRDTGRPAMIGDYSELPGTIAAMVRAAPDATWVGVPITVEGTTWGVIYACTSGLAGKDLPADIDAKLARFTELIATAVANAQARSELRGLAEEQVALRRIATLVAGGAGPQMVFDAICRLIQRLMEASLVNLAEFTGDGFYVARAGSSVRDTHIPPGTRLPLGPDSVSGIVARTGAPARLDTYDGATGELAVHVRERGIRATVAAPILVEGELWGAVIAGRDSLEPFAVGAEERLARFAELAATAISNATARAELIASRARIVAAGDEARRRVERNLHDGVQQRLIALGLDLQVTRGMLPAEQTAATEGVERAEREIQSVLEEVRELSRGLHPPMLSSRGLGSALRVLARRSPIGVRLEVELDERPPAPVETAVYYVVSEALANAVKHANATRIRVSVGKTHNGQAFWATIVDDGVGGAAPSPGSGLAGLADRVVALGGRITLDSPHGAGTTISLELPNRELPEASSAAPRWADDDR
jgi:GAF domain-containing protein